VTICHSIFCLLSPPFWSIVIGQLITIRKHDENNHRATTTLETACIRRRGLDVLNFSVIPSFFCCTCFVCSCSTRTSSRSVQITFVWAGTKKKEDDVYRITHTHTHTHLVVHVSFSSSSSSTCRTKKKKKKEKWSRRKENPTLAQWGQCNFNELYSWIIE
jgi:hypothetical protein